MTIELRRGIYFVRESIPTRTLYIAVLKIQHSYPNQPLNLSLLLRLLYTIRLISKLLGTKHARYLCNRV